MESEQVFEIVDELVEWAYRFNRASGFAGFARAGGLHGADHNEGDNSDGHNASQRG